MIWLLTGSVDDLRDEACDLGPLFGGPVHELLVAPSPLCSVHLVGPAERVADRDYPARRQPDDAGNLPDATAGMERIDDRDVPGAPCRLQEVGDDFELAGVLLRDQALGLRVDPATVATGNRSVG
jgi:hypothetical protein